MTTDGLSRALDCRSKCVIVVSFYDVSPTDPTLCNAKFA